MLPDDPDVVLIGPVAPPRGGIAAHIDRLAAALQDLDAQAVIFNHFAATDHSLVTRGLRRNPVRYWLSLRRSRARLVHYHHSRWSVLLATAAARGNQSGTWIVTFHGHQVENLLTSKRPGVARLTQWAISKFDHVVAVSQAVGDVVTAKTGRVVTVSPAYMPARSSSSSAREPAALPTVVVAACGTATGRRDDVYGVDIATAVVRGLRARVPNIQLELYLARAPGPRSQKYLDTLLGPESGTDLYKNTTMHIDKDLTCAFRPGVVFLRPTRTDGDSISVREALDAGIPVLASNVADRPLGALALPLENVDAWVSALNQALTSTKSVHLRPTVNADNLLSLYKTLLSRKTTQLASGEVEKPIP